MTDRDAMLDAHAHLSVPIRLIDMARNAEPPHTQLHNLADAAEAIGRAEARTITAIILTTHAQGGDTT